MILLSIEGKPAAGHAIIVEADSELQQYTVRHFLREGAEGELIGRIPEGRLLSQAALAHH